MSNFVQDPPSDSSHLSSGSSGDIEKQLQEMSIPSETAIDPITKQLDSLSFEPHMNENNLKSQLDTVCP